MEHSKKASFIRNKTWRNDIRHRLLKGLSMSLLLLLIAMVPVTMAYLQKVTSPVSNAFAAAQKYTLTYHENDGAQPTSVTDMPDPKADIVSYTGEFDIASDVPKREGYRFKGWNTDAGGEGDMVEPSTASQTTTYKVTGNATRVDLYAIWEPDRYQLIYDPNGGSIEGVEGEKYYDVYDSPDDSYTFTVKPNAALVLTHSDPNKVFLGWADSLEDPAPKYGYTGKGKKGGTDGIVVDVDDLDATITLDASEKTKTIYALWGTKYTLSFDENQKYNGVGPVPGEQSVIGTRSTHRFYLPAEETGPVPTREGYLFQWWSYGEDRVAGEAHFKFGEYIDLTDENPDVTLYARYYPMDAANVYFNGNAPVTVNNMPGQNPESAMLPTDAPNYPYWKFDLPDNVPTANGRTFLGWSTNKDDEVPQYKAGDEFVVNVDATTEVTLYAIWYPPHKFSVTFHSNAEGVTGTGVWRNSSSFWNGATFETAPDSSWSRIISPEFAVEERSVELYKGAIGQISIKKPNYRLAGYSTDPNAKDESDVEYPVNENLYVDKVINISCDDDECPGDCVHNFDLYAVWVPEHYLGIRIYDNLTGPSFSTENDFVSGSKIKYDSKNDNQRYVLYRYGPQDCSDTTFVLETSAFTNIKMRDQDSYRFLGWSTDPDAEEPDEEYKLVNYEGDKYRFENTHTFTVDEGDVEPGKVHEILKLYAVWEPLHRFSIHFKWNSPGEQNASWDGNLGAWRFDLPSSSDRIYYTPVISASQKTYTIQAGTTGVSITGAKGSKFLGWATSEENARNKIIDPAFELDENGKFVKDVVFTDPDGDDCKGGYERATDGSGGTVKTHQVKTLWGVWNAQHYYSVQLNRNAPLGSGSWETTGIPGGRPTSYGSGTYIILNSEDVDLTQKTYTIEANTVQARLKGRTGFRFAGWSTNPAADRPDPDYAVDENGYFVKDITLREPDDDCKGGNKQHIVLQLYAVWEPLHAFGIKYHVNAPGYYDYTIDYSRFSDGEGYYNASEAYFRTAFMPVTDNRVVLPAGTWKANITYFKNKKFMGWASSPENATAGIIDSKYELDENGCFKNEVVLEETTPCSAGNEVHYTDLYPVLKSAHFLEVKFEKGIADSIDVRDNSNRSAELHQNELSYTWDRQKIYAMASKSGYTFLGWSTDPDASDPQYTTLYHKIDQPITASITEHDIDACTEAAVHTALVLYPVFEKTYTLNYSANTGGSNAPAKQTATVRKPDLTGSYTFDIYDDVTNNNPPKRQQYRFMGWSTTQNGSAEYGYQNTTNNELGRLTRNLKNQIELTDAKDNITLYAVWWREYRFTFDANGGTGAPGDTYKYSTAATDTITVPQDIPTYTDLTGKTFTFLGWSTDPKAEEAQYVVPAPGTPDDQLQDNEKITLRCGNTGSAEITLYAVWQKTDD